MMIEEEIARFPYICSIVRVLGLDVCGEGPRVRLDVCGEGPRVRLRRVW